jgi:hypothetical protein
MIRGIGGRFTYLSWFASFFFFFSVLEINFGS